MKQEESEFSPELRKRVFCKGSEWGWKFEDIPAVIKECQKLDYAILGGQVQFIFPDATCEDYELKADPKERSDGESWAGYARRSCTEFLELFNELVKTTNFEKEALKWPDIEQKKAKGTNILDHMCFMLYPVSEKRYISRNYGDLILSRERAKLDNPSKPYKFASAKVKHQAFCRG